MPLRELRSIGPFDYANESGFPVYYAAYLDGLIGYANKGFFIYPFISYSYIVNTFGSYYQTIQYYITDQIPFIHQENFVHHYVPDNNLEVNKQSISNDEYIPGVHNDVIYNQCLPSIIFYSGAIYQLAHVKTAKYSYFVEINNVDTIYQTIVGYRNSEEVII